MNIGKIIIDDPMYSQQKNMQLLNIESAWKHSVGDNVRVAIIDSGIDGSHSDFGYTDYINITANDSTTERKRKYQPVLDLIKSNKHPKIVGGWNFLENNDDTWDDYRHGTYLGGVIGAVDNGIGIVGIAPNCKISPFKAVDSGGYVTQENVIKAINMAVEQGCNVINISLAWSYIQNSSDWESAINNAHNNKVIIVSATGNNNRKQTYYPANIDGIISVGGCNELGKRWVHNPLRGSNYGSKMNCLCPSFSQPTTFFMRSRWENIDGTSMATANMTGIVALLKAIKNISYEELTELIKKFSSNSITGFTEEFGWGVPDTFRMVSNIMPEQADITTIIKKLDDAKSIIDSIKTDINVLRTP